MLHTHQRYTQMDLYLAVGAVRNRPGNRLGVALVDQSRGQTQVDLMCSGWAGDTSVGPRVSDTLRLPGPADVLDRFGVEPFTLGTSAHAVLAHRRRWP